MIPPSSLVLNDTVNTSLFTTINYSQKIDASDIMNNVAGQLQGFMIKVFIFIIVFEFLNFFVKEWIIKKNFTFKTKTQEINISEYLVYTINTGLFLSVCALADILIMLIF